MLWWRWEPAKFISLSSPDSKFEITDCIYTFSKSLYMLMIFLEHKRTVSRGEICDLNICLLYFQFKYLSVIQNIISAHPFLVHSTAKEWDKALSHVMAVHTEVSQPVKVGDQRSSTLSLSNGSPQGCVPSPLIYTICTPSHPKSRSPSPIHKGWLHGEGILL